MAYNNFLNTPYDTSIPTIVVANARNYTDVPKSDKAFIVYCDPVDLLFVEFVTFIRHSPFNSATNLKKDVSFRNKRLFGMKLNLTSVFTAMQCSADNNICVSTQPDVLINIQKFFSPYYDRTSSKTQYWNVLSYNDLMIQLNLLYDTPVRDLKTNVFQGLRVELNYDLYCPFYEYPIRFVFQYVVK